MAKVRALVEVCCVLVMLVLGVKLWVRLGENYQGFGMNYPWLYYGFTMALVPGKYGGDSV